MCISAVIVRKGIVHFDPGLSIFAANQPIFKLASACNMSKRRNILNGCIFQLEKSYPAVKYCCPKNQPAKVEIKVETSAAAVSCFRLGP